MFSHRALKVPKGGLEPPRVAPPPPQDGVSTSFHHFGITVHKRTITFAPGALLSRRYARDLSQWCRLLWVCSMPRAQAVLMVSQQGRLLASVPARSTPLNRRGAVSRRSP